MDGPFDRSSTNCLKSTFGASFTVSGPGLATGTIGTVTTFFLVFFFWVVLLPAPAGSAVGPVLALPQAEEETFSDAELKLEYAGSAALDEVLDTDPAFDPFPVVIDAIPAPEPEDEAVPLANAMFPVQPIIGHSLLMHQPVQ